MPPVGFEPTILVGERPQTYVLDRAATGTDIFRNYSSLMTVSYTYSILKPYRKMKSPQYRKNQNNVTKTALSTIL